MNARVFKIDGEAILARLKEWAQGLVQRQEAMAVVLFGSLARGEATAASDADVLVLLRSSNLPFHQRIPAFLPSRVGVGVDLFPYTIEEFQKLKGEPGSVPHTALKEGLLLAGTIP